jgi:hypothetical protein
MPPTTGARIANDAPGAKRPALVPTIGARIANGALLVESGRPALTIGVWTARSVRDADSYAVPPTTGARIANDAPGAKRFARTDTDGTVAVAESAVSRGISGKRNLKNV